MRLPPAPQTLLSTLLFLPALTTAVSIDCSHVLVDGISFNLSPLSGPHHVSDIQELEDPPRTVNTTYKLDICRPLTRSKGVPKEQECEYGTQVCGIKRTSDPENSTTSTTVIPIAGSYPHNSGRPLDPKWTRLKTSSSHADSEKEGIRLEMHGGMFPVHDGRKQEAVVEFLCAASTEEEDGGDGQEEGPKFVGYGAPEGEETDVLRLEWRTRHACEDDVSGGKGKGGHWGFFTWFILIAFLGTASYLIFGSWLNYNRYGARGWDLLPHGDTIRDVPYLMKDWMRRVFETVQGGGARGGYSAV